MKQNRLIDSWNRIGPEPAAMDRMLQGIQSAQSKPAQPGRSLFSRFSFAGGLAAAVLLVAVSLLILRPVTVTTIEVSNSGLMPETSESYVQKSAQTTSQSDTAASEQYELAADSEDRTKSDVQGYASACYAAVSSSDLAGDSSLVLRGTVTGKSEIFHIQDSAGYVRPYVDYYIKPLEFLRGSVADGEAVSFRQEFRDFSAPSPASSTDGSYREPIVGKEYVLFLTQPNIGMGHFAIGNYYILTGSPFGMYEKTDAPDKYATFLSTETWEELKEAAAPFTDVPADPDSYRKDRIDTYQGNLETGFITQKEYDDFMESLDVYATVLESAVPSVNNDSRLALVRSSHFTARYLDKIPEGALISQTIACGLPWTDEERRAFFAREIQEVFLGTVLEVKTIEFQSTASTRPSYETVLEVQVDSVLSGNESKGKTVQVLLPQPIYEEANRPGADPMYLLEKGMRGIFPVTAISDTDCGNGETEFEKGEADTPCLYRRDLAEYRLDSYARGLVVETSRGLSFQSTDYPKTKSSLALEDFVQYLAAFLPTDKP